MTPTHLTVGLPVSQSGRFSRQGTQVLAGVTQWIRWTNERGGLRLADGQQVPLELVHYDDESRPAVAERLTRRLLRADGVDLLLGPYGSSLTLAAAPVAEAHETVLWNHSGATDALYDEDFQWLVSVLAPASRYLHGLLDLIRQVDRAASRVAVCWSKSGSFGEAVAAGAKTRARDLEFVIAAEHPWRPPLDDAGSLVEALRDVEPDVVLTAGSFDDDVRLVKALVSHESRTKAIGTVAAGISAFGDQLGETAHGVFGPSQWEPAAEFTPEYGPSPAAVVDIFDTPAAQPLDYPAAQAFAAGIVIETCLATGDAYDPASGTIEQRRVRRTADRADFTTFFGRFRIDPDTGEQVGQTPVVVQWQGDTKHVAKHVVWPVARRHVAPVYPTHWDE